MSEPPKRAALSAPEPNGCREVRSQPDPIGLAAEVDKELIMSILVHHLRR